MLKLVLFLSLFFNFYSNEAQASSHIDNLLKHAKSGKHMLSAKQSSCQEDSDCMRGYFCKNSDCIAKRSEGSTCLSGRDEECVCGQCILNSITWERICMSERNEIDCPNQGMTKYNNCKRHSECPRDYFCDHLDGGVCKSLLASGRLCASDEACLCGKCSSISFQPKPNRPAIIYNVCDTCP